MDRITLRQCGLIAALLWLTAWACVAQTPTSFTFTLDEPCKTSAGVYDSAGVLVRTLWGKTRYYSPGTYTAVWDGLDDSSNVVSAGTYQIKVLENNTEYVWDGSVGNTSAARSGNTVHSCFYTMHDMAITGTNAFYCNGYNEARYDFNLFSTLNPQVVLNKFGQILAIYDRTWSWAATDGTWVYFAAQASIPPTSSTLVDTYPGFVLAYQVADQSPASFSQGVAIKNNYFSFPNGLYVGTQAGISGLAVQQSGNILAVSVAPDNKIYFFDKRSGAALGNVSVPSPGRLSFGTNNTLWAVSGNNVVCITGVNGTPAIQTTISGFSEPLAIAVSTTNANLVLVADGGSSQQLKAYDTSGNPLWIYGLQGGYPANGPAVTVNKFWFYYDIEGTDGTFISFAPDGSFWVGDGANHRSLHFSSGLNYLEQIMWQPHSYMSCVDQNNPSRVFNQFLEFSVDYTKPLSNAWTLVNNWMANVDSCYNQGWYGLRDVTTMTNGRTYALILNSCLSFVGGYEVCELTSSGLRMTGVAPMLNQYSGVEICLGPDGSVRGTVADQSLWLECPLGGFDVNNDPVYGTSNILATATENATDPVPRCCTLGAPRTTISSNNIVIGFDPTLNDGYHLGGVRAGGNTWLWRVSPTGTLNGKGNFENSDCLTYAGNTVHAIDRNIVYGFHGEFFRCQAEAGQHMHYYDDGLFVGEFGESFLNHALFEMPLAGFAGNGANPCLVKTATGDYYLYVDDEAAHGPERWHLVNTRNIREQSGSGSLGKPMTLSMPAYGFPSAVTGASGNQMGTLSWSPVAGATSYNVQYSTLNGGPFQPFGKSTSGTQITVGGLNNGSVYYFAVTAVVNGTEGIPSEQVEIRPFDTTQPVVAVGHMREGLQNSPTIDISSANVASNWPSFVDTQHSTANLNVREVDFYGYGDMMNTSIGTKGYVLCDFKGPGASVTNLPSEFALANGQGWQDITFIERMLELDGVMEYTDPSGGSECNLGWQANPTASLDIHVVDTNYHCLTVLSPARFADPRVFTTTLTSTNGSSVQYAVNESSGYTHTFQFLFRGNVTLTVNGSGGRGLVKALFFDDIATASGPPPLQPPTNLHIVSP